MSKAPASSQAKGGLLWRGTSDIPGQLRRTGPVRSWRPRQRSGFRCRAPHTAQSWAAAARLQRRSLWNLLGKRERCPENRRWCRRALRGPSRPERCRNSHSHQSAPEPETGHHGDMDTIPAKIRKVYHQPCCACDISGVGHSLFYRLLYLAPLLGMVVHAGV